MAEYYLDSFEAVDSLERLIKSLQKESWRNEEYKDQIIVGVKMSVDRLLEMSDRAKRYNLR